MEASYTSTPQYDPDVFPAPQIWTGKKGESSTPVKEFNLEARALLDSEVVDKTIGFIEKQASASRPFYIYAAFTQIHPPFLPQPGFVGKSRAHRDIRRRPYFFCEMANLEGAFPYGRRNVLANCRARFPAGI